MDKSLTPNPVVDARPPLAATHDLSNLFDAEEDQIDGQPLAIDLAQQLTPEEQDVVRQSDAAFIGLRRTWARWKAVGAGLLVLRNLAMRETGSTHILSNRYKTRFHELLQQRPYRGMSDTARKDLLQCVEHSLEIDEWLSQLDEERRLGLNHPARVWQAFRKSQGHKPASRQSRRARYEAELEKIQKEAAIAVSSRDALIEEKQKEINRLTKHVDDAIPQGEEAGIKSIVRYVVAKCETAQQIQEVIKALTAHLEQLHS